MQFLYGISSYNATSFPCLGQWKVFSVIIFHNQLFLRLIDFFSSINRFQVKPSSFNHSRNKIIDFCNRMKDQVAVDIFPLKKSLPKDNFVRVYREFKNKMMRGVNDIFYDIIKKFRVVHESGE